MKFLNSIIIVMIIIIYTLAFTMHPLGALTLAGAGSEVAEVTEVTDETESETEVPETQVPYSADDFYELSHVIQAEAGYTYWDMMIGVGSVVLNRVASDAYPNTIYEVIHQTNPIQYSTASYLDSQVPTAEVEEVTDYLLRNGSQYPENVLYQANFPQGSGTYLTLTTRYSTMFFCYG